ncbi:MAG: hypothetical protein KAS32_09555 [Candidatus Peribacteraceae bacterium]|nr:hypothetical protein [Candidatus Peribacteraceae bacterium]
MATRDIASDLGVQVAFNAAIASDTVTNGTALDTAHYDSGYMFFIDASVYSSGDFTLTLEDSPTGSGWTAVPAEKLIKPEGDVVIDAATSPADYLKRIGAFSTERYLRAVVTSANSANGTIVGYAVKMGELKPVVTS